MWYTVLRELRRVLLRKFGVPRRTAEAAETFVREEGEIIREAAALGIELDDPDDVPILEEAVAGRADLLVTKLPRFLARLHPQRGL